MRGRTGTVAWALPRTFETGPGRRSSPAPRFGSAGRAVPAQQWLSDPAAPPLQPGLARRRRLDLVVGVIVDAAVGAPDVLPPPAEAAAIADVPLRRRAPTHRHSMFTSRSSASGASSDPPSPRRAPSDSRPSPVRARHRAPGSRTPRARAPRGPRCTGPAGGARRAGAGAAGCRVPRRPGRRQVRGCRSLVVASSPARTAGDS